MKTLKFIRGIFIASLFLLLPVYANNTDCDFGPYMKDLQTKIKSDWRNIFYPYAPKYKENTTAKVLFKLDKNGNLLNVKMYPSSGYAEFDDFALKAVNRNTPYKPLPSCYEKQDIDVLMTFEFLGNNNQTIVNKPHKTTSNEPKGYPQSENIIYNELSITPKGKILKDGDFAYFNIYEKNSLTQNIYLSKCKLDCKNKTIGVIKSNYISDFYKNTNQSPDLRNVEKFDVPVKMQSIDKNNHYKLIYNYVCSE